MLHIKSFHYLFTFIDFLFSFNTAVDIFSQHKLKWWYQLNPRPKQDINRCFWVCHWNLKSVTSHNFFKIQSLIAYNCILKFDLICLSNSYLNSNILSSDSNLQIPGYNFARMDYPSNTKCGFRSLYCNGHSLWKSG